MDIIEKIYDSNKTFAENENFKGVKKIVVDNYSDEAHFVYELLQNADDAQASEITFDLHNDRLIIRHNGRPFNEKDVEGICSISKGTKSDDYTKIGKFGIGFKSVFVYTESPQIYSGNYKFKIRDLVLPSRLDNDIERDKKETVFVLPFNVKKTNTIAYESISGKLESLHEEAILFLKNIKHINVVFGDRAQVIEKRTLSSEDFYQNSRFEHIKISKYDALDEDSEEDDEAEDNKDKSSYYYLFSRNNIKLEDLDDDGNIIEVSNQSVMVAYLEIDGRVCSIEDDYYHKHENNFFVFFPTRIRSNCEFFVHAPFITKSSRDTIAMNNVANNALMKNIGILIADSMLILAKKNQLSVNLLEEVFFQGNDYFGREIVFGDEEGLIYSNFKKEYEKLLRDRQPIVPCRHKKCRNVQGVLFTSENDKDCDLLLKLFDIQLLSHFFKTDDDPDICFVGVDSPYYYFICDKFECKKMNIISILHALDSDDYESQTSEWFKDFVGLIVTEDSYTGYCAKYVGLENFPLIRTKNQKHLTLAQADDIYLNNGTIDSEILDDPKVLFLYKDIFKLRDYSVELSDAKDALNQLVSSETIDFTTQAGLLRKILIAIENKKIVPDDYKDAEIFLITNQLTGASRRVTADEALIGQWQKTNDIIDLYILCSGVDIELLDKRYCDSFSLQELKKLGCNSDGLKFEDKGWTYQFFKLNNLGYNGSCHLRPLPGSGNKQFKPTGQLKHFDEILESSMTIEKSVMILRLAKEYDNQIKDWVQWSSRKDYGEGAAVQGSDEAYSLFGFFLISNEWLYDKDGNLFRPGDIKSDDLSLEYRKYMTADIADKLGIKSSSSSKLKSVNKKLESEGYYAIPIEQKEAFEEFLRLREAKNKELAAREKQKDSEKQNSEEQPSQTEHSEKQSFENSNQSQNDVVSQKASENADDNDIFDDDSSDIDKNISDQEKEKRKRTRDVVKDIVKRTRTVSKTKSKHKSAESDFDHHDDSASEFGHSSSYDSENNPVYDSELDIDSDELMPSSVDYQRKIDRAKEKSAAEIEKIANEEELQSKAMSMRRYSFGWFKTLLQMESLNSNENNSHNREVSISFAKVEREPGTKRTLMLKHPNRYIPQFMEDLADIPLMLYSGNQVKKVAIEVSSVKSYTLQVKMKNGADIDGIDLSTVTSVTIDVQSPSFLIDELLEQFKALGEEKGFDDSYDMQQNLPENIGFIFGPPGTGKTTSLAKEILIPLMKNPDCRVLVLTPTNKSADVLTKRVMEIATDNDYENWLVRFGTTDDEDIEDNNIFRDKTFDITSLRRSITITTIARFPYDFFMPPNRRLFLRDLNWDYIVFDEASMIPIANITYALYKKTPQKFIIAGDPFQIEPITSVDIWKDENIYTMVNLNSFADPHTVPYEYPVAPLTTQYRSVPDIGSIFSSFAYGGILQHDRSATSQRKLNLGKDLNIDTINIIKFPVSKYESIYRCKKLNHSSNYQIYSAIFTYEFVCYLSRKIAENNPGDLFKIGIIAPYRAQADIIEKLFTSENLPSEVDVQVGTIHGFQGDECDIIFAVFNPPPYISYSENMFLNKKNIINVSISRARDYLFIVMPDDDTENINNLRLVKRVEKLAEDTGACKEFLSPDLEKLMFGDSNYLENNAFSTSHQSVNVYGLPEKRYEIRTEDSAVDVQVHKNGDTIVDAQVENAEIS